MTVRIGVAGVAGMGLFHVLAFPKHEGAEVTALCDPWDRALESAAGAAPEAARFTDFSEMCASGVVDAVVVATPNAMHPSNVRTALSRGLHVYCEKPLAVTVGECCELAELARGSRLCVQVGFQHRYEHAYASAKRIVEAGGIGSLRRAHVHATDWFRPNAYFSKRPWRGTWREAGGGVLMLQAIHQLDAFLWICGMPSRVTARAWRGRPNAEVEDDVYALLEFGGGAHGVLCASTLDPVGTNRIDVVGDAGALVAEGGGLRRATWDGPTSTLLTERTNLFESVPVEWADVESSGDPTTYDDCVVACQREFLDAISEGRTCGIDCDEATRSVELVNAVYLSAVTGEPVDLPLDADAYAKAFERMCTGELGLPGVP